MSAGGWPGRMERGGNRAAAAACGQWMTQLSSCAWAAPIALLLAPASWCRLQVEWLESLCRPAQNQALPSFASLVVLTAPRQAAGPELTLAC